MKVESWIDSKIGDGVFAIWVKVWAAWFCVNIGLLMIWLIEVFWSFSFNVKLKSEEDDEVKFWNIGEGVKPKERKFEKFGVVIEFVIWRFEFELYCFKFEVELNWGVGDNKEDNENEPELIEEKIPGVERIFEKKLSKIGVGVGVGVKIDFDIGEGNISNLLSRVSFSWTKLKRKTCWDPFREFSWLLVWIGGSGLETSKYLFWNSVSSKLEELTKDVKSPFGSNSKSLSKTIEPENCSDDWFVENIISWWVISSLFFFLNGSAWWELNWIFALNWKGFASIETSSGWSLVNFLLSFEPNFCSVSVIIKSKDSEEESFLLDFFRLEISWGIWKEIFGVSPFVNSWVGVGVEINLLISTSSSSSSRSSFSEKLEGVGVLIIDVEVENFLGSKTIGNSMLSASQFRKRVLSFGLSIKCRRRTCLKLKPRILFYY